MGIDMKSARQALRSAGVGGTAICGLAWPFGRERRVRTLVRRRQAVLEAKNSVVDVLFRSQRALAELSLHSSDQVQRALEDPEKRRLILSLGVSRGVLEEELGARYGTEVGRSLEQALSELVAEGVVLRVAGQEVPGNQVIYLAVYRRGRPHYDVSGLNRVLQESRGYGSELRARARRGTSTDGGRTYRL